METLEIVIGLIFIFLLLSLLATTVQELVASISSLRGKMLLKAIAQLLEAENDEGVVGKTREKLLKEFQEKIKTSKVFQKYSGKYLWVKQLPSYLSSDQITAVINDLLDKEIETRSVGTRDLTFDTQSTRNPIPEQYAPMLTSMRQHDLRQNLNIIHQSTRQPMPIITRSAVQPADQASISDEDTSKQEELVNKAKLAFKKQYDEIMDRATGWYKRSVQAYLLVIGLVIAIAFDADTFKIYTNLTQNPDDRQELIKLAESFIDENKINIYNVPQDSTGTTDTLQRISNLQMMIDSILQSEINNVPVPLGLGWNDSLQEQTRGTIKGYFIKIFGWIVTALAISLGAPFWFDMLQKVIRIRNSGNRPDDNTSQKVSSTAPKR